MRVLFLDIDGVLNSIEWQRTRPAPTVQPTRRNEWRYIAETGIDPDAVERLNGIVEATGCVVVLSSSWRKAHPLPEVTRILRYRGARFRLLACTPSIHEPIEKHRTRPIERGLEIEWWIESARLGKATCVILDDDRDMGPMLPRLVQTDGEVGLTDEDAGRVIAMLRGEREAA